MPWTVEEIEKEWLRGESLQIPADDVLRAFAMAEEVRGRDWVLSTTYLPGGSRMWGIGALWRVYWFGTRLQAVLRAKGSAKMIQRLKREDPDTESELTAIFLLRSQQSNIELEVEPQVASGHGHREPDFRIRKKGAPWIYVEVKRLHSSLPSEEATRLIDRIADAVMEEEKPFILEIVLRRELTVAEEEAVIKEAIVACQLEEGSQKDVGELAWLIVKAGHPASVVPTPIPEDAVPRIAIAKAIQGPSGVNRQIIVKVPFADQRAEDILRDKAKQLPKEECGLVMVDICGQPAAFESWPVLIPPRFTKSQHTRVGGVLLFMTGITPAKDGVRGQTHLEAIPNPHARIALPKWVTDRIEIVRAENRQVTGKSD